MQFAPVAKLAAPESIDEEFERYAAKYGKTYSGEAERAARLAAFRDNRAYVAAENAKGNKYTLELNEFADMTPDEFAATHYGMSRPEKLWGSLPHLGTHRFSGADTPSEIDWVTKGAVTPVKNQGQCGSSSVFSAVGSIEGAWEIASGNLVSLSE